MGGGRLHRQSGGSRLNEHVKQYDNDWQVTHGG